MSGFITNYRRDCQSWRGRRWQSTVADHPSLLNIGWPTRENQRAWLWYQTIDALLSVNDRLSNVQTSIFSILVYYHIVPIRSMGKNMSEPFRCVYEKRKMMSIVNTKVDFCLFVFSWNSCQSNFSDGHFATATIRYIKDLASIFGNDVVFFLSQDDKCKVPIGLPAAKIQAPMLMHLDYRVRLPDHDWTVAPRHQLTPR